MRTAGIRIPYLCDTGGALYQLRYRAIWKSDALWGRNIPVDSEDTSQYMKGRIYLRCEDFMHADMTFLSNLKKGVFSTNRPALCDWFSKFFVVVYI